MSSPEKNETTAGKTFAQTFSQIEPLKLLSVPTAGKTFAQLEPMPRKGGKELLPLPEGFLKETSESQRKQPLNPSEDSLRQMMSDVRTLVSSVQGTSMCFSLGSNDDIQIMEGENHSVTVYEGETYAVRNKETQGTLYFRGEELISSKGITDADISKFRRLANIIESTPEPEPAKGIER